MSYTPFKVEGFGGLNLTADPQEASRSAISLLNVDFDRAGRIRTRDGSASSATYSSITRLFATANRVFVYTSGTTARAYAPGGSEMDTQAATDLTDFVAFGDDTDEYVYYTRDGGLGRYDLGADSFSDVSLSFDPRLIAVTADNRIALGGELGAGNPSIIRFSDNDPDASLPQETFAADNYVLLSPGDGEYISGMASFNNMLFVFKQTKFFVFYGTSTDATGAPIFNYREVPVGLGPQGTEGRGVVSGRDGIYFLAPTGIYRTAGGTPEKVSGAIDPLFLGSSALTSFDFPVSGEMGAATTSTRSLTWHRDRLWVIYRAYPGGTAIFRMLTYDPATGVWMGHSFAAIANGAVQGLSATGSDLYYSGGTDVYRLSNTLTTDSAVAIPWHYQSGWYDLSGRDAEAFTRYTSVRGIGTATVSVFTDYGTNDANAAAVTLGSSPTVDEGLHQKSYRGALWSHRLSGTGVASINGLTQWVSSVRPSGRRAS